MITERRLRALKGVLVVSGLAFSVGVVVLTRVWPSAWMWEPRQSEYEQMIIGVYVTLGVFLLIAARDPLRHLSLIWFAGVSSVVHGGIMAIQATVDPGDRANFAGDIPALLIIGIALMLLAPRARDVAGPADGG